MIVRREHPRDHDRVREVHRAAFRPADAAPDAEVVEARLTDELRDDVGFLPHLSLVAVVDGQVVGHVIATRGWVEPVAAPALGLGPLGVAPEHQRRGIGSALVHALVAVAEACDERVVVLLGSPAYYGRLGFRRSTELGIDPPEPAWAEHFQARSVTGEPPSGTFRYAAPFQSL